LTAIGIREYINKKGSFFKQNPKILTSKVFY